MLNHDPDRDPTAYADYLAARALDRDDDDPQAAYLDAFTFAVSALAVALLLGVGIVALTAPALALFLGR